MKKTLLKLDALIQNLRPDYYKKLNPPLSENDIFNLERNYNFLLPMNLKELYFWKNGQNSNCHESFINNSEFMPLEDVFETSLNLTSMIGFDFEIENWWNKNWLPLFHNGGGSYICWDSEGTFTGWDGQILEFWKADNDRNIIAPNLETFLNQLVDLYENNAENLSEPFEVGDLRDYPRIFYL